VSITATQFFARYSPPADATERCYYCCGRCEREFKAADYVKSSFTSRDTVALSEWVCPGCVKSLDEKATIRLLCGEVREGQMTRGYSWVATVTEVCAGTKAHRKQIASLCLFPPQPPFMICISDSGQKHLLYRSVVSHSQEVVTLTLEGERIRYRPVELAERFTLLRQVCAATGKPALLNTITPQTGMRVIDYFGDDLVFSEWQRTQNESLTRLAAWICPPKEECQNEYPECERIEDRPIIAEADGPAKSAGGQTTFSWAD